MKQQSSAIYLFALGHLSVDWAQGAIPALLPYFIAHYGLNYQSAGALIFANVLLASILQPLFGYYSDKISRPWFVPLGPVLCGLAVTAMDFSRTTTPSLPLPSSAAWEVHSSILKPLSW